MPGTSRKRKVSGGGEGLHSELSETEAKPATERMSLTPHYENSILGMLRKIADQLDIPEQGQSEAQLALDIHLILKDLEVSEQPLQGKYVEMNKRELPVRGNVGYNKKAKLFEDLSVCHCKVFPLMSLPDTVLSRVFKSLDIKDKKNLRLVNRWLGKKIKILDSTFRAWKIVLNEYSEFKEVQGTLGKAKIDDIFLNYSINIGLLNREICQAHKKEMLIWILNVWGVSVKGLSIFLEGHEEFLLNEFFSFPHLEMLHLENDNDEWSQESDWNIELVLMKRHANTLTKLSVCGYWDLIHFPYEINLPCIQSLRFANCQSSLIEFLTFACSENVRRIDFECCYSYVTLKSEIKMPKLLHISIESSTLNLYRFAEQFAEQLISLKIHDLYDLDKRAKFRNLKYLWIDEDVQSGWNFIQDCSSTLEQLVCKYPRPASNEFAPVQKLEFDLPNLRDLYIMGVGYWRATFNAENLEFLFLSRDIVTTSFYDELRLDKIKSNMKYPNLKTLLLPGCINDSLVDKLTAEYPSKYCLKIEDAVGLQADSVLTLKQDVNRAMRLRAKEFYQCLDLVPFIQDDCPIR